MRNYKISTGNKTYNIIAKSIKNAVKKFYIASGGSCSAVLNYQNHKYLLNLKINKKNDKYQLKIKSVDIPKIKKIIAQQSDALLSKNQIGGNLGISTYYDFLDMTVNVLEFNCNCTFEYAEKVQGVVMYLFSYLFEQFGIKGLNLIVVDIKPTTYKNGVQTTLMYVALPYFIHFYNSSTFVNILTYYYDNIVIFDFKLDLMITKVSLAPKYTHVGYVIDKLIYVLENQNEYYSVENKNVLNLMRGTGKGQFSDPLSLSIPSFDKICNHTKVLNIRDAMVNTPRKASKEYLMKKKNLQIFIKQYVKLPIFLAHDTSPDSLDHEEYVDTLVNKYVSVIESESAII